MSAHGFAEEETTAGVVTLGRYELRLRLATGGMASVYLAKARGHAAFEKWVAVKVINPQLALDKSFVRMFLDEARLVARLNHPNICSVLDFGTAENTYFLAMEYLHGESLSTLNRHAQKHGGMPDGVAARIIADAARGLHAAHELKLPDGSLAKVVHRDVSPQNIFVLYDGVTKVVDFGIARSVDRTAERTSTGIIKGKLAYMAPEQLRNAEPDRRIDIFALGIVLWEITTGKRLFQRQHEAATMCAVLQEEIPSPSSIRANYPQPLADIIARALDRDPDQRYQTAAELARDLDRFIASSGLPTGPEEVAQLMHAQFARKIAARDKLLNESTPGAPTDIDGRPVGDPLNARPPSITPSEGFDGIDSDAGRLSLEPPSAVARKPSVTGTLDGSALSTESVPVVDAPTHAVVEAPANSRAKWMALAACVVLIPLIAVAVWMGTRDPAVQRRTVIYAGPTQPSTTPQPAQQHPLQAPVQAQVQAQQQPPTQPPVTPPVQAQLTANPGTENSGPTPVRQTNPTPSANTRRPTTPSATSANTTSNAGATPSTRPSTGGTPPSTPSTPSTRPSVGPRPATDFNQL